MGQQYTIKRQIDQRPVTENNIMTYDVPRSYDIASFIFRLSGSLTLTGAGATAVRSAAPTQLIKRIELIADGKNTIASVPGWAIRFNVNRGQFGFVQPPSGFAAGTYPIEMVGTIDQALIDGVRQKDSNLRTAGMQLLQLKVTMGAANDCFLGVPVGSFAGGSLQLETSTVETVELPDDKGVTSSPLYMQKKSYQDVSIPNSNANQQIILPIGNAMRGCLILATDNGEPSNAVLNAVELRSGVDVRMKMSSRSLQRLNSVDYDVVGLLSNITNDAEASLFPIGLYSLDLMRNGLSDVMVTNAWDLSRASEAKLVVDVTAGTNAQLSVVTTEFLR